MVKDLGDEVHGKRGRGPAAGGGTGGLEQAALLTAGGRCRDVGVADRGQDGGKVAVVVRDRLRHHHGRLLQRPLPLPGGVARKLALGIAEHSGIVNAAEVAAVQPYRITLVLQHLEIFYHKASAPANTHIYNQR